MKKRTLRPLKNSVVCVKVGGKTETVNENGVFLKKETVPLFKIVEYAVDDPSEFKFSLGDTVMSTSTGDEIEINEGETIYLFKAEHIMCRVLDEKGD